MKKDIIMDISSNYEVDRNDNLCITFCFNLNIYLKQKHSDNGHRGIESLRNMLLKDRIYYKGVTIDLLI